jgi:aromatic ring-opening dioxygenase catalytic subunit (LigB family)
VSQVVVAIATVHAPFITGLPHLAPEDRRRRVYAGFAELRTVFEAAQPDLILAFSSEHITNFLSGDVRPFCVGLADSYPVLPEFNLPQCTVPGDADFARNLVSYGYQHDFDFGYASHLLLDHGTGMPLHFISPHAAIPVVPILQNTIWSPMHTMSRAFQAGRILREFVEQDGANRRVAVLATGGVSHWVGNARHGDIDQEFDEWFLAQVASGDYDQLRSMTQEQIDVGGDGANEIRNWVALAGAVGGTKPRVVLDETFVPGWNTSAYQVVWENLT